MSRYTNTHRVILRPRTLLLAGTVLIVLFSTPVLLRLYTRSAPPAVHELADSLDLDAELNRVSLSFVANAGQSAAPVKYQVNSLGGTLFFTPGEVVLALPSAAPDAAVESAPPPYVLRLRFQGAAPTPAISGADPLPGVFNYFIGNDPSRWLTGLTTYAGLEYAGLYPGIDLHYNGSEGVLKGTYAVAPGADPAQIRWSYVGAAATRPDPDSGDLWVYLTDPAGSDAAKLIERAPLAWQEIGGRRIPVEARYVVEADQSVHFELGSYDPAYPLTLDPTLQYSSYLGGLNLDQGWAMAIDASGGVYVTGRADSLTFPVVNPIQANQAGGTDAFVTKINVSSGTLIYSTYLGGDSDDYAYSIAVDGSNNAYVTGETQSLNFPTTASAYQRVLKGSSDAFVVKLNPAGSALTYSTFLGGSGGERGNDIAVNSAGNMFVAGQTNSTNFDAINALQTSFAGGVHDAFVTVFAPTGANLVFSTYLGGEALDTANGIAIDSSSNVYIAGRTNSLFFPVANAYQWDQDPAAVGDAFVSKISTNGLTLLYSTYLGGSGIDEATSLAVDASGSAYITGSTDSTNFPRQNAYRTTLAGMEDAFVTKLAASGSSLVFSTYLGGSTDDGGSSIAVGSDGKVYLTGQTSSSNFPVQDALLCCGTYRGSGDAFVTQFTAAGTALGYSSFLGGSGYDSGLGIAVDAGGAAFITGETTSTNFPLTATAAQFGGTRDAFVVRIGSQAADLDISKLDDPDPVDIGQTLTYNLTITNNGPDSTNAIITDPLPAGVSYVSVTSSAGSCTRNGSTITCNLGTVSVGSPVTVQIVTTVTGDGVITNTASVASSQFDTNPLNNQRTQSTTVRAVADLGVSKAVDTAYPQRGDLITFLIRITNNGPNTATGIRLTDTLPSSLTYDSFSTTNGQYVSSTGVWTLFDSLAPGESATLNLKARVRTNDPSIAVGSRITNTTSNLVSGQIDPNAANNFDDALITIRSQYPLAGCYPVAPGSPVIACTAE